MKSLKSIIRKYILAATFMLVIVVMVLFIFTDIQTEQNRAVDMATASFDQIDELLSRNAEELAKISNEYNQSCLLNVEKIAYILESKPSILHDADELKHVADMCEVDEIHIFNKSGEIISGTRPDYYGLTFESGEQIGFFKPLLNDKSLKLVQEITPNTAERRLVQYSASWSNNGEFIIQIGMDPSKVSNATAKNELSYIFAQFHFNPEVEYYAIERESGQIIGASTVAYVGSKFSKHVNKKIDYAEKLNALRCKIDGNSSFCVFSERNGTCLAYVISEKALYKRIPYNSLIMFICLFLVSCVIFIVINSALNKYVVNRIAMINKQLEKISAGQYDERIDVAISKEFSELSRHINNMVNSILAGSENLSYALSKTDMHISTYQYSPDASSVSLIGDFAHIFMLSQDEAAALSSDVEAFKSFLARAKTQPVSKADDIFAVPGDEERYIKINEQQNEDYTFGVIIDVTKNIAELKEVEQERDIDVLTGIYNRRALDQKVSELISSAKGSSFCAVIVLDIDNLKMVNDSYGHKFGDEYIAKMAEVIKNIDPEICLPFRQGGDEFILLLHDCSKEQFYDVLKMLDIQNDMDVEFEGKTFKLSFSYGFSTSSDLNAYSTMFSEADRHMYISKKSRKERLVK